MKYYGENTPTLRAHRLNLVSMAFVSKPINYRFCERIIRGLYLVILTTVSLPAHGRGDTQNMKEKGRLKIPLKLFSLWASFVWINNSVDGVWTIQFYISGWRKQDVKETKKHFIKKVIKSFALAYFEKNFLDKYLQWKIVATVLYSAKHISVKILYFFLFLGLKKFSYNWNMKLITMIWEIIQICLGIAFAFILTIFVTDLG